MHDIAVLYNSLTFPKMPNISMPNMSMPNISMPNISMPEISILPTIKEFLDKYKRHMIKTD